MDWIRRNWPDLIIGFALLAVIAGIIATLLSGGSFFPFGNSGPNSGTQPAITSPQVGQTPSASTPSANTPATTETVSEAPPPGPPVLSEDPELEPAQTSSDAASGSVTVVSPEAAEPPPETGSVTPLAPDAPVVDSAAATAPTTESPAQAGTSSEASALFPESPYRISVGSYRDEANAQRRAESFMAAGYPVFIGRQDDLAIVLVGPYDSRADAEAAVATIQRDGLEAAPLLFELSDDPNATANVVEAGASAASSTASNAVSNIAETATNAATAAQSATPVSGLQGSYIQAGAYDSSEGARPQRERLEGFGFVVAEVEEGSFVKLLVGPFSESDLSSAQARLSEQGVEHFVRTF